MKQPLYVKEVVCHVTRSFTAFRRSWRHNTAIFACVRRHSLNARPIFLAGKSENTITAATNVQEYSGKHLAFGYRIFCGVKCCDFTAGRFSLNPYAAFCSVLNELAFSSFRDRPKNVLKMLMNDDIFKSQYFYEMQMRKWVFSLSTV